MTPLDDRQSLVFYASKYRHKKEEEKWSRREHFILWQVKVSESQYEWLCVCLCLCTLELKDWRVSVNKDVAQQHDIIVGHPSTSDKGDEGYDTRTWMCYNMSKDEVIINCPKTGIKYDTVMSSQSSRNWCPSSAFSMIFSIILLILCDVFNVIHLFSKNFWLMFFFYYCCVSHLWFCFLFFFIIVILSLRHRYPFIVVLFYLCNSVDNPSKDLIVQILE